MGHTFCILLASWLCLLLPKFAQAQTGSNCINTLAKYNFQQRTACVNASTSVPGLIFMSFQQSAVIRLWVVSNKPVAFFIVPVNQTLVAQAVLPYKLLPLPTSDKSLFPWGFPAGKFPVVVQTGLQSDIRMNELQLINNLYEGSIVVPYVDRLGDGKTPFRFAVKSYIGGVNNADVNALVPGKFDLTFALHSCRKLSKH